MIPEQKLRASPAVEELRLDIPGLRLAARAWGDPQAPVVLALHGWLDNAATFDGLAPLLPDVRLVAIDLPGHGLSQHRSPDANYHFIDWIPDVLAAADALGWERFALLGHSMGGAIASVTAATAPERVERLVLIDGIAPHSATPEEAPAVLTEHVRQRVRLLTKVSPVYASREMVVEKLLKAAPHLSTAGAWSLVGRGTREVEGGGFTWTYDQRLRRPSPLRFSPAHIEAFLRRVRCPVLVVRPETGYPIAPALLDELFACLEDVEVARVPGAHHVHLDAPEVVAGVVRGFLATPPPAPQPSSSPSPPSSSE